MRKSSLILSILCYAVATLFSVAIVFNLHHEMEYQSLSVAILTTKYEIRLLIFLGAAVLFLIATLLLMYSGRDIHFPSGRSCKLILAGFALGIPVYAALIFYDYYMITPEDRAYIVAQDNLETIERRNTPAWYSRPATMFERLGDYKDAREKSEYCWYKYAENWTRFLSEHGDKSNTNRSREIETLQNASKYLIKANGYLDSAERLKKNEERIAFLSKRIELRHKLDQHVKNRDYIAATSLLDHFQADWDYQKLKTAFEKPLQDQREKAALAAEKEKELLERARLLEEQAAELAARLGKLAPDSVGLVTGNRTRAENVQTVISSPAFQDNPTRIAELLVDLREFDSALAFMKWVNDRKKGPQPALSLGGEELLWMLFLTLERESESAAAKEMLEQFIKSPRTFLGLNLFDRFSALLLLFEPGPELARRCFPDDPRLLDIDVPGSLVNRVLNAPAAIRNAFLERNLVQLGESRFTRKYTPAEAEALFRNFTPSRPFAGGYIYISEHRNKPSGVELQEPSERDFEYQADYRSADIAAEAWREGLRSTWTTGGSDRGPSFICVSNPNNARLAIHEIHDYRYIGKYTIEGYGTVVDVYLPTIVITVGDLVTGKTLFREEKEMPQESRYVLDRKWVWSNNVYCPVLFYERREFLKDHVDTVEAALAK